jgi:hypothetical protein
MSSRRQPSTKVKATANLTLASGAGEQEFRRAGVGANAPLGAAIVDLEAAVLEPAAEEGPLVGGVGGGLSEGGLGQEFWDECHRPTRRRRPARAESADGAPRRGHRPTSTRCGRRSTVAARLVVRADDGECEHVGEHGQGHRLDQVGGVGPVRLERLVRHFETAARELATDGRGGAPASARQVSQDRRCEGQMDDRPRLPTSHEEPAKTRRGERSACRSASRVIDANLRANRQVALLITSAAQHFSANSILHEAEGGSLQSVPAARSPFVLSGRRSPRRWAQTEW